MKKISLLVVFISFFLIYAQLRLPLNGKEHMAGVILIQAPLLYKPPMVAILSWDILILMMVM